jgi:dCTP deaminase
MAVIALTTDPALGPPSVVTSNTEFHKEGTAVLIQQSDIEQLKADSEDCNSGYDLRVGDAFRDHRNDDGAQILGQNEKITLRPGNAVIIRTQESVEFPEHRFGEIFPKVGLLQKGIANTPSKVDPGLHGL